MTKTVFLALLLLSPKYALAQNLPRYDVVGYCTGLSELFTVVPNAYADCFAQEQAIYNRLKQHWEKVPQSIRTGCDESAQRLGGGYGTLSRCIEDQHGPIYEPGPFQY